MKNLDSEKNDSNRSNNTSSNIQNRQTSSFRVITSSSENLIDQNRSDDVLQSDNDQKRKENEDEDEDEDRWMYESIIQSNRNRAIQSLSDTLEWVSRLIENDVSIQSLRDSAAFLSSTDYEEDVIVERKSLDLCGFPICSERTDKKLSISILKDRIKAQRLRSKDDLQQSVTDNSDKSYSSSFCSLKCLRLSRLFSEFLEDQDRFDRDQLFRVLDESFRAREAQSVIHPTTSKIPSSRVVITTPTDDCQGIDPVRSDSSQSKGLESLLSILSTLRIYERQLTLTKDSSMPEGQETINPPTVQTPGPPTHPTHQSCLPVGGSDPQDKGGRTSGNDLPNSSSCPSSSKFKNESRFLDPIERIVQSKSQSKDGGRGEDYLESYLFPETGIDEMMKAEVGYDLNDEGENGGVRGRDEGRVVYDVDCYEDRMLIDFARGLRDE